MLLRLSLISYSDINSTRTDDVLVAIIKDFDDIYQDTRDVTSSEYWTSYWN